MREGQRFCEKLIKERQDNDKFTIVCIGEEPRKHYNRMLLTEYFEHRQAESLFLASEEWYTEHQIQLLIQHRVERIDSDRKRIETNQKTVIEYDYLVLATGSTAFIPKLPGNTANGVFVYRTICDLNQMIAFKTPNVTSVAIIGGGLLGLEAAKALRDLGLNVFIIERNPRLMPRQLDDQGGAILLEKVLELGVQVRLQHRTQRIVDENNHVTGIIFEDGTELPVQMVVFATGIRPRDDLALSTGIAVHERRGIIVNDTLETNVPDVFAIGECVSHRGISYGLVAPGYAMAQVLATHLIHRMHPTDDDIKLPTFTGGDLSTKLKLLGVEVATFGQDYSIVRKSSGDSAVPLIYNNPVDKVYKKLVFSSDGKQLLSGILVGDAQDYSKLLLLSKSTKPLKKEPGQLLIGSSGASTGSGDDDLPDEAQVCSCNNVTKGEIRQAVREKEISCLKDLKVCTNAGTGCGGCLPLVKDIFHAELQAMGSTIDTSLCEHFAFTRKELFDIILIKEYRTFTQVLENYGRQSREIGYETDSLGCEICKPTIASILASLYNSHLLDKELFVLQDSNDRLLANIQKNGQYSVIPRIPGGEITPEKLEIIAQVAKKYGLYTKITGGQRIDLLGASGWQLPMIWKEFVEAGFESGHAYGKALRTVKSCVGSSWCRFGRGDAVSLAILLEERYRGIRSPHKLKGAVSGCVRECAEAQSKDFGLIATELGYNLYVGGNGGTTPKHAQLLASDLTQEQVIRFMDRYLMYYIHTADRLQRTSVWLSKLEGGVDQLRRVVIEDSLGIAQVLEDHMQRLIKTYVCEWKAVVEDPEKQKLFRQFCNTDVHQETQLVMENVRGQHRPPTIVEKAVIPDDESVATTQSSSSGGDSEEENVIEEPKKEWIYVGEAHDFPLNSGGAILYGQSQLAVFQAAKPSDPTAESSWFITQNMCPHTNAFVLSHGIIGDVKGQPKVACPLHKATFALDSGECLSTPAEKFPPLVRFEAKQVDGKIFGYLPPEHIVDEKLATFKFIASSSSSSSNCATGCANSELEW